MDNKVFHAKLSKGGEGDMVMGRPAVGDPDMAKHLLETTKQTIFEVSEASGCNLGSVRKWSRDIRGNARNGSKNSAVTTRPLTHEEMQKYLDIPAIVNEPVIPPTMPPLSPIPSTIYVRDTPTAPHPAVPVSVRPSAKLSGDLSFNLSKVGLNSDECNSYILNIAAWLHSLQLQGKTDVSIIINHKEDLQ